ncbi:MAG: dienelactone hydrolase family protein [Anaerolineae bacterium]|nr:dienelactone hydrolase family protein [Anaerolineae bacterium]
MVWIKRILVGLLLLLTAIVLLFGGIIVVDAIFGRSASDYTNITFTGADGVERVGYLATPDGDGPHPAVLLIHEWWGLNDGITELADALAAEGYVVLAADAYRGETTRMFPRALWLRITTPQEQIFADVDAAFDHLRGLESVDAERVASMGFCFGGGESLQLGMRQGENLALTILYYGSVVTDPDLLRPLTEGKGVLGIFGEEDQQIFVEDVIEFEAALNTLDIPNEITIYPEVGHAFLNEDNYDEPGTAMDAWQQTLAFLEANLKNP